MLLIPCLRGCSQATSNNSCRFLGPKLHLILSMFDKRRFLNYSLYSCSLRVQDCFIHVLQNEKKQMRMVSLKVICCSIDMKFHLVLRICKLFYLFNFVIAFVKISFVDDHFRRCGQCLLWSQSPHEATSSLYDTSPCSFIWTS